MLQGDNGSYMSFLFLNLERRLVVTKEYLSTIDRQTNNSLGLFYTPELGNLLKN